MQLAQVAVRKSRLTSICRDLRSDCRSASSRRSDPTRCKCCSCATRRRTGFDDLTGCRRPPCVESGALLKATRRKGCARVSQAGRSKIAAAVRLTATPASNRRRMAAYDKRLPRASAPFLLCATLGSREALLLLLRGAHARCAYPCACTFVARAHSLRVHIRVCA